MRAFTLVLSILACACACAADVRIIVGNAGDTRAALAADTELPANPTSRDAKALRQQTDKLLAEVTDLGTDPAKSAIVAALADLTAGEIRSLTWKATGTSIDFSGQDNCKTQFAVPVCNALGQPRTATRVNVGQSCRARCGPVKVLAYEESP